jgi:hypothetical protein
MIVAPEGCSCCILSDLSKIAILYSSVF